MTPIGEITTRCSRALAPELSGQSVVHAHDRNGDIFAFEFRWTDGRLYKVVVSSADDIGVENMAYPPPAA